MFFLYGYDTSPYLIYSSSEEYNVICKLAECIDEEHCMHYSIVLRTPEQDFSYKLIYSEKDFIDYVEEYKASNKQKVKVLGARKS